MKNIKNILILGGGGFIGTNFVEELIGSGISKSTNITVMYKSVSLPLNKLVSDQANIKLIQGNYRNINDLENICRNRDIIYHFISETFPHTSWGSPALEVESNFIPTIHLLDAAAKSGVKKIVFLSSAGTVYGLNAGKLNEDTFPNPFTPHGIFKYAIEKFLNYYRISYGLNYDIYRVSNAYGPNQNVDKGLGFINVTLNNIISNKPALIYGDGKIVRDFIYVKDVAKFLTLSLKKPVENSDLYIISSGKEYTLNEVVDKIKEVLQIPVNVTYHTARLSDNKVVKLDNSKILKLFPDFKLTPLEEGIGLTYRFISGN